MRRRSGNSLAWQSVLTEQDQTRYLRFGDVEVWEFDVGFDKDFGRYNNYEHYEFFCRPLEVAKTTTGGNGRTGMNTIQAILHSFHHSVREHDDFMDTWMAIASANALSVELVKLQSVRSTMMPHPLRVINLSNVTYQNEFQSLALACMRRMRLRKLRS